jgi:hypothetical protein
MATFLLTVDEVLDALGGDKAVGALFGYSTETATNWRRRGYMPPNTYVTIIARLKPKFSAPASLWRMAEPKVSTPPET